MVKDTDLQSISQTELAKLLGTSTKTIQDWENKEFPEEIGPFPGSSKEGVQKKYRWRDCLNWYVKYQAFTKYKDAISASPDGTIEEAKARKEWANAKLAELELDEAQKKLIPAKEAERVWSAEVLKIRSRLLSLGSKLSAMFYDGITPAEKKELIDAEIHDALKELSEGKIAEDDVTDD